MASREDIISTIVDLSSTMADKVNELVHQEGTKVLVQRANEMQKKGKGKGPKKESSYKSRKSNNVQISCCLMSLMGKKFVKESPLFEVDLTKEDNYSIVKSAIALTVGVELDDVDSYVLLTSRGIIIGDDDIFIGSKAQPWSLGAYLNKRHVSPDKLVMGIGNALNSESDNSEVSCPKTKRMKVTSHNDVQNEMVKGITDDEYKVFYYNVNDMIPLTRLEIWEKTNGAKGLMDVNGVFNSHEHEVFKITLARDGADTVLLRPSCDSVIESCLHSTSCRYISFTSYLSPKLKSSKQPIPLIVIAIKHAEANYKWESLENPNLDFPSHPVVFVNAPQLYQCTVLISGKKVHSEIFDVGVAPIITEYMEDACVIEQNDDCRKEKRKPPPSVVKTVLMANPSFNSLVFSKEELLLATDNLNNELGVGGFGKVFLANNLRSSGTKAAVKVLNEEGTQALVGSTPSSQITAELTSLMKFRHPNILEAMGYCFTESFKALVYQYMENDCLFHWIHISSDILSWKFRESILMDMLRGVAYLHAGNLIHQDIKSNNVLIDENFRGKVGDFGFAWEVPEIVSGRTMVTAPLVARSEGYFPPEILTGKSSPLCDVYSCGVVVLETYTGLPAYDKNRCDRDLVTYTEDHRSDIEQFILLADKRCGDIARENAEVFLKISNASVQRYSKRSTAFEVLKMWEK